MSQQNLVANHDVRKHTKSNQLYISDTQKLGFSLSSFCIIVQTAAAGKTAAQQETLRVSPGRKTFSDLHYLV